jgi:hypothetical protein
MELKLQMPSGHASVFGRQEADLPIKFSGDWIRAIKGVFSVLRGLKFG